jgi:hypothetical protein
MTVFGKFIILGVAIFAAAASTEASAQTAAFGTPAAPPQVVPSSHNPPHYQVPAGYDADVAMHPYSSGLGPCPDNAQPAQGCHHPESTPIPPSRYDRPPFTR